MRTYHEKAPGDVAALEAQPFIDTDIDYRWHARL
jgi:hypothetical protein